MKEPLFSVVVPCFNCGETLPRLMQSLESQTFKDFELILVDDCSTEPWQPPARANMLLKTPKNGGPGVARQLGLDNAKGMYVTFIDSDDQLISPLTLSQVVTGLKQTNYPDIMATCFIQVDGEVINHKDANSIGWVHGKFYRRDFLQTNDIRFPDWRRTEDGAFNYVAFASTGKIVYANNLETYLWMYNPKSIVRSGDYTLDMVPDYAKGYARAFKILKAKDTKGLETFALRGSVYLYLYCQAAASRGADPRRIRANEKICAEILHEMGIPKIINGLDTYQKWSAELADPIRNQLISIAGQEPSTILLESFPMWVARLTHKRVKLIWKEGKPCAIGSSPSSQG